MPKLKISFHKQYRVHIKFTGNKFCSNTYIVPTNYRHIYQTHRFIQRIIKGIDTVVISESPSQLVGAAVEKIINGFTARLFLLGGGSRLLCIAVERQVFLGDARRDRASGSGSRQTRRLRFLHQMIAVLESEFSVLILGGIAATRGFALVAHDLFGKGPYPAAKHHAGNPKIRTPTPSRLIPIPAVPSDCP